MTQIKKNPFRSVGGGLSERAHTHMHMGLNPVSMRGPRMSKHSQQRGAGWHG